MTLYGLDPVGDGLNDTAQLREIIELLKQIVGNLQGMDRANRKCLKLQERIMEEQAGKIENLKRQVELLTQMVDTQQDTLSQYRAATSLEDCNEDWRLNQIAVYTEKQNGPGKRRGCLLLHY